MSAYYVYMIRCADGSVYTGITTDLSRRMHEHECRISAKSKYTASHPMTALCAAWSAPNRSDASKLEYWIKRLDKAKKECLIADQTLLGTLIDLDALRYQPIDPGEIS